MIESVIELLIKTFRDGNKVIVFGVGGNAATAIHFAAELAGKYEDLEDPLPCIDICSNVSILTAITNDFGWDQVFSRQILGLANKDDVVLAFSIRGEAEYLKKAFVAAREKHAKVVLINGSGTPNTAVWCTECVVLHSSNTPKVQERQLELVHRICQEVKEVLWQEKRKLVVATR